MMVIRHHKKKFSSSKEFYSATIDFLDVVIHLWMNYRYEIWPYNIFMLIKYVLLQAVCGFYNLHMYILLIMEIYLCWYSNWWWSFVIIKKFPSKELPLVKAQLSASSQVINIYVNKVLFYPRGHSFCSHIWLFEIIGNDGWLGGTNVGNEFSGKEGGNHESCKLFHERGIWVYFPLFFWFLLAKSFIARKLFMMTNDDQQ